MITLKFETPRPDRTVWDIKAEAERLKTLSNNEDFRNVAQTTADRIVSRWAKEKSPEVREQLWHTLQGLQEFLKMIDLTVENASRL